MGVIDKNQLIHMESFCFLIKPKQILYKTVAAGNTTGRSYFQFIFKRMILEEQTRGKKISRNHEEENRNQNNT